MKKILFTICLTCILLLISCDNEVNSAQRITINNENESMFQTIEDNNPSCFKVVYHKETKVMYVIANGNSNRGTFTILINSDGTPMVWKGSESQ